jgi:hypothetical protein
VRGSTGRSLGTTTVVESDGPRVLTHTVLEYGNAYFDVACEDCNWYQRWVHRVDAQDALDRHHCPTT